MPQKIDMLKIILVGQGVPATTLDLLSGNAPQLFPSHWRPMTRQPGPRNSWRHTIRAKRGFNISKAEWNLLHPSLNTRGTKFKMNWMPKFSRNWRRPHMLVMRRNVARCLMKVRRFLWGKINISCLPKNVAGRQWIATSRNPLHRTLMTRNTSSVQ